MPDTAEAIEGLLARSLLLLAVEDDEVVGTLVVGWDGWRGTMYRLAVVPELRRRGIARQLVEAGHDRLAALGARRVGALVGTGDEPAAALWRAAGYELDRNVERFVRNL
jgi:ribosomal protein S18 acetylase RimI-like enzyme